MRAADLRVTRLRLQRIARRLRLGQNVLGAALTFVHRCRAQWQRAGEAHPAAAVQRRALACLFLAAKVEENPQRMRDVLNMAYILDHGRILRDSHEYWQLKEQLVRDEQLVLRDIGFDLRVPKVHRALFCAAHALHLGPATLQLASDAVNDSFAEPLTLRYAEDVIVSAAITIAHAAVVTVSPELRQGPMPARWWEAIGVREDELRSCLARLLPLCQLLERPTEGAPATAGEGGAEEADLVSEVVDALCTRGAFPTVPCAPPAGASGEVAEKWQQDPSTGYYYSVTAQAYFDSTTKLYFVSGGWAASLPSSAPACESAPAGPEPPPPSAYAPAAVPVRLSVLSRGGGAPQFCAGEEGAGSAAVGAPDEQERAPPAAVPPVMALPADVEAAPAALKS
ncbi:hypothetical protein T492DRAFT_864710 [Pavlovales sp. CCMP2436]|nr:hypothetical protein T492DRAFT_864710 [Pavlovales sp. CCMP2436]